MTDAEAPLGPIPAQKVAVMKVQVANKTSPHLGNLLV